MEMLPLPALMLVVRAIRMPVPPDALPRMLMSPPPVLITP